MIRFAERLCRDTDGQMPVRAPYGASGRSDAAAIRDLLYRCLANTSPGEVSGGRVYGTMRTATTTLSRREPRCSKSSTR